MTKKYYYDKTERLLKDLDFYKSSLDYYGKIRGCAELTLRQHREMNKKAEYMTRTLHAVEHALTMLNPTERDVVTKLYLERGFTVDDVCEVCALERSSIYRYRSSALKKIAKALYGAE